jgi:predicted AAA+ superfamily ATPase
VGIEQMEAARRRMLEAQQKLKDYEEYLGHNPSDSKRFKLLYARAQVSTQEYLSIVAKYFKERYGLPQDDASEEPPEAQSA